MGFIRYQDHLEEYERLAVLSSESTDESVQTARKFVNKCLKLHRNISDLEPLAAHVKALKRMVEQLETQSNKIL